MQRSHGGRGCGTLHHTGQDAAGAAFVELGDASIGRGLAIVFPEDRGDHLLDQRGAEIGRLGERAAGGVGVDGDLGALEFDAQQEGLEGLTGCLLYTSPSPRDRQKLRMWSKDTVKRERA